MQQIIYVERYLTSAEYYGFLLPKIQLILKYYDKTDAIILDFSGTLKIEPNVIPNLLCIGQKIKDILGYNAIIRIPDTYEGGKIKKYLFLIGFTKYSKGIYDSEFDLYTGFEGKTIDPLCGTVYFESQVSKDEIGRKFDQMIGPFAEKYLRKFDKINMFNGQIENDIINLLKELAVNAKDHGKSFSYTTVHAKYSKRIIYISISDAGQGFFRSCMEKYKKELLENNQTISNEVEAILYCIYVRKASKIFGLYSVINNTITNKGIVRIHSNDSQVIFTNKIKREFEKQDLLKNQKFWKYYVRRNLKFDGTHIELEIPF